MKKHRLYCNSCNGDTLHELVAHYEHERYDDLWGYPQLFVADTFKCSGCEDITFRLTKHPFEFQDEKDLPVKLLFPERKSNLRKRRYFFKLPKNIHTLYNETVTAYDKDLLVLSTIGLRTLIEAIVVDKIARNKYKNNLESKITALSQYFSDSVIQVLHDFRLMGNKAAHELDTPESLNIHHALFVVEDILQFFYGIDEHEETFRKHRKSKKAYLKSIGRITMRHLRYNLFVTM